MQTYYLSLGRELPDDIPLMAHVYSEVLEAVPDRYLEVCFKRALKANRTDYVPSTGAVHVQWDMLLEELRAIAREHARQEEAKMRAGHGSPAGMGLAKWKRKHNLPLEWKLGNPYPPESDLYGTGGADFVKVELRGPSNVWEQYWHAREKKPWEIYPPAESPDVRRVKGMDGVERTFASWLTRCIGDDCPGYYEQHTGPEGRWVKRISCPVHWSRWDGRD